GASTVRNLDLSRVDDQLNTITLPNHGLKDGQIIVYHAPPSGPVGGLADGTAYRVIVKDANTIQLAKAPSLALDATGISSDVLNTLSRRAVQSADAGAVNLATDVITLPGHGLSELQPVTVATSADWNLAGLEPQDEHAVHVVDADHIQLLTRLQENAGVV